MVTDSLYAKYSDKNYIAFSKSLSPTDTLPRAGIRIPVLRMLAKEIRADDIEIKYHEDVILKALALSEKKCPFRDKIDSLSALLPYLSSWDQTDIAATAFKVNKRDKDDLYAYFHNLLKDERVFPRRLGIVFLMGKRKYFDRYTLIKDIIASDIEDEYYISMAVSWALSFFYLDDESSLRLFAGVNEKTLQRTKQKIRDSKRYKGGNLEINSYC